VNRRLFAPALVLGASALLALTACTVSPAGSLASAIPSGTATSSPASFDPTSSPTDAPSTSPSAAAALEEPPVATLRSADGQGVPGDLGSYAIGDQGSDSPWLPGEPVTVAAGESLSIELDGVQVERWQARVGTQPDTNVEGLGEGNGPISFDAPSRGTWSLAVRVMFAGGDASYYWGLTVR
jgi:hypothetical protein